MICVIVLIRMYKQYNGTQSRVDITIPTTLRLC